MSDYRPGQYQTNFPPVATDPVNPAIGQVWYNTTEGKKKIRTATGTEEFQTSGGGTGIQLVNSTRQGGCSVASLSADINHPANSLIVIIGAFGANPVVKVGGQTATLLTTYLGYWGIWYAFRSAAATDQVLATFTTSSAPAMLVLAFTGTKTTTPWFEGASTTSDTGKTSYSVLASIAAGTTGRLIITSATMGASGSAGLTLTLDSAVTQVESIQQNCTSVYTWMKAGTKAQAAALSVTHTGTQTQPYGSFAVHIAAILPA